MSDHWPRDIDAFYISYDEPNCEDNWARVLDMLPQAKRTHGVKGFDAAHKACAEASQTERFLTIDGDNWLLADGLDTKLDDTGMEDVVFSFKSRNAVNGLEYGNGGVKCWRRDVLLASNTHESSDSTDFCWDLRYYQVDTLSSIGVNNATPSQAWRAGYREGVKMSYVNGKPMSDPVADRRFIAHTNHSKLQIWMAVGRDVTNGAWAMLGARQGFCDLYSGTISNTVINDYDWFAEKWKKQQHLNTDTALSQHARRLRDEFDMFVPELDQLSSQWFKKTYVHPQRRGLML